MSKIVTIGDCTLYLGDSLAILPTIAAASVDSVVCDPPYELGFMGKAWDASGIAYNAGLWREVCRVLKPGGYLLAFGGTRTYHRMTCAIEDAGFEIRDCIQWLYGSGFPKSLDVSKAIDNAAGAEREVVGTRTKRGMGGSNTFAQDAWTQSQRGMIELDITAPATPDAERWQGWGTALKPANEPIVVARKPLVGTVAANVLKHGTGAINVDACRVATADGDAVLTFERHAGERSRENYRTGTCGERSESTVGRWPANVIHDGSDEVLAEFAKAGERKSTGGLNPVATETTIGTFCETKHRPFFNYGDSGSAARFFYCAKAGRSERGAGNRHPTVKPLALARYLVRLVTPPGGVILTPFLGSGTEIVAAVLEGFGGIGIEIDAESFAIACKRIREATRETKSQLPLEVV